MRELSSPLRPTPNRLLGIPPVARCACGSIVIAHSLKLDEMRWCDDCRAFVEDIIRPRGGAISVPSLPDEGIDLHQHLEHVEVSLVADALKRAGTVGGAARLLKLNRTTLVEKIKRFIPLRPELADFRGEWPGRTGRPRA